MRLHTFPLSFLAAVMGLLTFSLQAQAADTCDHHRFYASTVTTGGGKHIQRHTYETTLSTDQVRVFRQRSSINAASYLCARRNGHLRRLGIDSGPGAAASDVLLTDLMAVGPTLGYDTQTRGDVNQDRFRAIDALTGRVVTDSGNVSNQAGADEPEFAMARSGALAWIVSGVAGVADQHGSRTVSSSVGGRATELAVSVNTAYFLQGGTAHSVPLG